MAATRWRRFFAELKRYQGEIELSLDAEDAADRRDFVDSLLDSEPNMLDEGFRAALLRRTDGQALFTVELLRAMRERGDLVRDAAGCWMPGPTLDWDALPARVEGVIAERIERLAADLRAALTVASVEGEEFTAEVVAQVRKEEARELVRRLSEELQREHRLVRAEGLRQLDARRLALYRFQHNLFQKYLYNGMDAVERAYLHEDVGNALEALYREQTDEVAVQLARHFEEAGVADKAAATCGGPASWQPRAMPTKRRWRTSAGRWPCCPRRTGRGATACCWHGSGCTTCWSSAMPRARTWPSWRSWRRG